MSRPADYPPPFGSAEFVTEPSDPVDERIEVGVLVVGAGTVNDVAAALRHGAAHVDAVEIEPDHTRPGPNLPPRAPLRLAARHGVCQ